MRGNPGRPLTLTFEEPLPVPCLKTIPMTVSFFGQFGDIQEELEEEFRALAVS